VAGITVGLTVIPQAIAYANVAGLPLQVNSAKLSELFVMSIRKRRCESFDLDSRAISFQNQQLKINGTDRRYSVSYLSLFAFFERRRLS
jgi:hypothetical protein